jgi:hypothetical protein
MAGAAGRDALPSKGDGGRVLQQHGVEWASPVCQFNEQQLMPANDEEEERQMELQEAEFGEVADAVGDVERPLRQVQKTNV